MVYCETIETSKTWTCPKSGVWKVICVGGGGAGLSYYNDSTNSIGTAGGTTSFGSILSASGGISGTDVNKDKIEMADSDYSIRYVMGINVKKDSINRHEYIQDIHQGKNQSFMDASAFYKQKYAID